MAAKKGDGRRNKGAKSPLSPSAAKRTARGKGQQTGRAPARAAATQAVYGFLGVAGYAAEAIRGGSRVRKNMDMDQGKLSAAQAYLGARSETEAVNAALDLVVFQKDVAAGIDRMVRAGGVADIFGE
jgi:hypothetical protein